MVFTPHRLEPVNLLRFFLFLLPREGPFFSFLRRTHGTPPPPLFPDTLRYPLLRLNRLSLLVYRSR